MLKISDVKLLVFFTVYIAMQHFYWNMTNFNIKFQQSAGRLTSELRARVAKCKANFLVS